MSRSHSGTKTAGNLDGFVRRKPADAQKQRREVFTVHELHRDEWLAVNVSDIENTAHVGMRHLAGYANFIVETRQHARILRGGFRQKFESHGLAQAQVVGAVNFAHPAFAEASEDPVTFRE